MAQIVALIAYILLVLIPINGLIWMGMRAESQKQRVFLRRMIELKMRRRL